MSKISNHEIRNINLNDAKGKTSKETVESSKTSRKYTQTNNYVQRSENTAHSTKDIETISSLMNKIYEEKDIDKNLKNILLLIIKNINNFLSNEKDIEHFFNKMNEFLGNIIKESENETFYEKCSVPEFEILSIPLNNSRISIKGAKSTEEEKELSFSVKFSKQSFYIDITPLFLDLQRSEGRMHTSYNLNLYKSRAGNVVERTIKPNSVNSSDKFITIEEFFHEVKNSLKSSD